MKLRQPASASISGAAFLVDRSGLTDAVKSRSIELMNSILGTTSVLLFKVWGFHWNMVGDSFHPTHKWFQKLYESLSEDVDSTAERVRAMNGKALGSLSEMIEHSIINETIPGELPSIPEMINILLLDYETSIRQMRNACSILAAIQPQDDGDLNYLQDMIMRREKDTWMLRANS